MSKKTTSFKGNWIDNVIVDAEKELKRLKVETRNLPHAKLNELNALEIYMTSTKSKSKLKGAIEYRKKLLSAK